MIAPLEDLTDREAEVLHLLAEGLTNPEIGGKLYLSEKTIKWHAAAIYRKIGVRNRVEAAITYHIWTPDSYVWTSPAQRAEQGYCLATRTLTPAERAASAVARVKTQAAHDR